MSVGRDLVPETSGISSSKEHWLALSKPPTILFEKQFLINDPYNFGLEEFILSLLYEVKLLRTTCATTKKSTYILNSEKYNWLKNKLCAATAFLN